VTTTTTGATRRAHFRRAHDGHVAIQNKYTQQWADIKCDLQVPGLLLIRETDGQVSSQFDGRQVLQHDETPQHAQHAG